MRTVPNVNKLITSAVKIIVETVGDVVGRVI